MKENKKTDFERMNSMDGNSLPVSSFIKNPDGTFAGKLIEEANL